MDRNLTEKSISRLRYQLIDYYRIIENKQLAQMSAKTGLGRKNAHGNLKAT